LILGVGICPLLLKNIITKIYEKSYAWDLSPRLYFLAPGQQPRDPLTQLLIINKTGASIDDFIRSVEHQNIALEVDIFGTKNGLDDPSYNGAIIVSGNTKNYRFSLACNTKRLNCFPVLMDIISNALLGMITPSAHIQTDRSTFLRDRRSNPYEFQGYSIPWLILTSSCTPYIAMSSIDDYKSKAQSQLWISGLFPSAYWCGQALVDISVFILLLLSMYLIFYIANITEIYITSRIVFGLVVFGLGYATSLVFLTYVISFIFRKWKKNSGLWSFCFYIASIIMFDIVLIHFTLPTLISTMVLVPSTTMGGFLAFLAQVRNITDGVINFEYVAY